MRPALCVLPSLPAASLLLALTALVVAPLVLRTPASPSVTTSASAPPPVSERPRVLARVGDTEITSAALRRYMLVREISSGAVGDREALSDLCDRALLLRAAAEKGLAPTAGEVAAEVLRKQLLIGAALTADANAWTPPPAFAAHRAPGGHPARGESAFPFERAHAALAGVGLTDGDLSDEAAADATAAKVQQALVYDAIPISREDLLAAGNEEQRAATDAGRRAPPGNTAPGEEALRRAGQRLRRERGAPKVAALLGGLRARWKIETMTP